MGAESDPSRILTSQGHRTQNRLPQGRRDNVDLSALGLYDTLLESAEESTVSRTNGSNQNPILRM